jgi:hypothetical protein
MASWREKFRSPSFADPPPPAVLLDRPVALLHLHPPPRRAALVHAGLVLGYVALLAVLDHLPSRLQPIGRESPHLAVGADLRVGNPDGAI